MLVDVRRLTEDDVSLFNELLEVFGEVFFDLDTYTAKRPGEEYLKNLLRGENFLALVALDSGKVVAGLTAYQLEKYEQERSEIYIYDLAVLASYRRLGIATALISKVKKIALQRGAWVVFVQADTGVEDEPAVALYSKLGKRAEVLHFDIEPTSK